MQNFYFKIVVNKNKIFENENILTKIISVDINNYPSYVSNAGDKTLFFTGDIRTLHPIHPFNL